MPKNQFIPSEQDHAQIREAIEDGQYFKKAFQWYRSEFVAPIGQRNWMIVMAGLAIFMAISALLSLSGLLPLTYRPAIPAAQENIWDYVISGDRIRQSGESRDAAILRFFVTEYIHRRESYVHNRYDDFKRFVKVHSTEENFESYETVYGTQNPRSLHNVLGKTGRRVIDIQSIDISYSGINARATVTFKTSFFSHIKLPSTKWRVRLKAYYRPMTVKEQLNVIDSTVALDIVPASFKVSEYVLEKLS